MTPEPRIVCAFSPCRRYRYAWETDVLPDPGKGLCAFIGLNPDLWQKDPDMDDDAKATRDWEICLDMTGNLDGEAMPAILLDEQ